LTLLRTQHCLHCCGGELTIITAILGWPVIEKFLSAEPF